MNDLEKSHAIGKGSFGVIHIVKEKSTGHFRALKTVRGRDSWDQDRLQMEAKILQNLDHPHILRIFSWCQEGGSISIVMEFSAGGEFLKVIQKAAVVDCRVPEAWAVTGIRQALEALVYIHGKGVVHKDLKGDNLLLLEPTEGPQGEAFFKPPHVVVCDMGLSEVCHKDRGSLRAQYIAGTPSTMAPEVWSGNFGPLCDMWSMGCIVYEIFAQRQPFRFGNNNARRPTSLLAAGPDWSLFMGSEQAVAVCKQLLSLKESDRPTAAACLSDPWFEQSLWSITKDQIVALCKSVQKWRTRNASQRALCLMLAAGCTSLKPIAAIFSRFDTDNSGTLDMDEIVTALMGCGIDQETATKTAFALDINNDGLCEYLEFSAAALPSQKEAFKSLLYKQFKHRDIYNRGVLGPEEVALLVEELKPWVNKHGLTLQDMDLDGDGVISFQEFCEYFGGGSIDNEMQTRGHRERGCENTCEDGLGEAINSSAPPSRQVTLSDVQDLSGETTSTDRPFTCITEAPPTHQGDVRATHPPRTKKVEAGSMAHKRSALLIVAGLSYEAGCSDWTQWPFLLSWRKASNWIQKPKTSDKPRKRVLSL